MFGLPLADLKDGLRLAKKQQWETVLDSSDPGFLELLVGFGLFLVSL